MVSAAAMARPVRDLAVNVARADAAMGAAAGQVRVKINVDISHVAFDDTEGGAHHATLEIAVFCQDRRHEPIGQAWQTLELSYTDDALAVIKRTGLEHTMTVPVTSLPENAAVVVYDYGSDRIGTQFTPVTRGR